MEPYMAPDEEEDYKNHSSNVRLTPISEALPPPPPPISSPSRQSSGSHPPLPSDGSAKKKKKRVSCFIPASSNEVRAVEDRYSKESKENHSANIDLDARNVGSVVQISERRKVQTFREDDECENGMIYGEDTVLVVDICSGAPMSTFKLSPVPREMPKPSSSSVDPGAARLT